MQKKLLLIAICGLLGACAPQNQVNLINAREPELSDIKKSCAEKVKDEENIHAARTICTFEAWEALLKEDNFKDVDLLNDYHDRVIKIASAWDAGKLSKEKAESYFKDAHDNFIHILQQRDAQRTRRYVAALAAMSDGLNQAPQYRPTPMPSYTLSTQPSMPPVMSSPTSANNSLINSYNQPPPAPMGMGQGASGYNGTVYIPAGVDPNPTPNLMGR